MQVSTQKLEKISQEVSVAERNQMLNIENLSPQRQAEYERRLKAIKENKENFKSKVHRLLLFGGMLGIRVGLKGSLHYEMQAKAGLAMFSKKPIVVGKKIPSSVSKMASDVMEHAAFLGDTDSCKFLHEDLGGKVSEGAYLQALDRKRLGTAGYLWQNLSAAQRTQAVVLACMKGCMPALNMFKYHQADFNEPYEEEERLHWYSKPVKRKIYPLEGACAQGQSKAIHFLIENGAKVGVCHGGEHIRAMVFAKKPILDEETKKFLIQVMHKEGIPSANRVRGSLGR